MICYRPFELHTHTQHSDGQFTTESLLRAAKAYGFEGVALTDHNALTAALDVTPALERETVMTIPGIEWTTFFGHMLVLGCERFVDWRFVTPDTIDKALEEIRSVKGVVGVAHPCEVGAPLMCGCHWDFHVTRWDLVSYVEIWSAFAPMSWSKNQLVLPWYDALLNEGHHLALTAGRDWHAPDRAGHIPLITATYLGLKEGELSAAAALDALRAGRTFVTLGPVLALSLVQDGDTFGLSETAKAGHASLSVEIDETQRRSAWEDKHIQTKMARLIVNGACAEEQAYTGQPLCFALDFPKGWARIELYGDCEGREGELLVMTSPFYFA